MSDFYQLTNSTLDFKSRTNDIFDKLVNLEKEHDAHNKTRNPMLIDEDDKPSTSHQNPAIPKHAITFKKRSLDDDTFTRPSDKWKKYDLDDVNEHHLSSMGNRRALNDFLRTRTKPSTSNESEKDDIQSIPIFRQRIKKEILTDDNDEDNHNQILSIRAPLPANEKTSDETVNDNDNEEGNIEYKLKSNQKKNRGVLSTNKKANSKSTTKSTDEIDDDLDDEYFEP